MIYKKLLNQRLSDYYEAEADERECRRGNINKEGFFNRWKNEFIKKQKKRLKKIAKTLASL